MAHHLVQLPVLQPEKRKVEGKYEWHIEQIPNGPMSGEKYQKLFDMLKGQQKERLKPKWSSTDSKGALSPNQAASQKPGTYTIDRIG
jgi:hypothetical protein